MKTGALLGLVAVGCVAAAFMSQSAFSTIRVSPKAAPSPKPKTAIGAQFGGATAIAPEGWIKGIEPPEIQYMPRIVSVAFDITATGRAENCRVDAPIPQSGFGGEVCAAVERNARFLPKRGAHGKPVSTRGWIRFRFEYADS